MELTWVTYLIVCPLVFLAGLVDSVAGGGGLISLPAYMAAGLPPHMAAGTNKLSACIGTTAAALRFYSGRAMAGRIGLVAAAGALPGSWLGAQLQQHIPAPIVRIGTIVVIPIVAAVVLGERKELKPVRRVEARFVLATALAVGLLIGFYDGLVGPGTGTFLILLFTLVLGLDPVTASGTAKVVNLASNVAALVSYLGTGNILPRLGIPAACCAILGNLLGAQLTLKRGTAFIRRMLIVVMCLLLVRMVWDVVQ